jgi:hypothetical protein
MLAQEQEWAETFCVVCKMGISKVNTRQADIAG